MTDRMPYDPQKRRRRRLLRLIWAAAVVLSLLLLCLLVRGDRTRIRELTSQTAAERWGTEEKVYAQTAVYLPEGCSFTMEDIPEMRLATENAMTAAGVPASEYPWLYACSCSGSATLSNENASTEAEITYITGDYFTIHPMTVVSGWYMSETEAMHDRILLDRQTAWDLFYSDNVAGQYCELGGVRFLVAGVVEPESGRCNELAAGDTRRAWVLADSPASGGAVSFTCIEMVLPQPITGFAVSTLTSVLESTLPKGILPVDITGRFSLLKRFQILKKLDTRGISTDGILYPWFENAARLTENRLALRLIPEAILALIPIISLLFLLLWLNHRRTWGLHSIPEAIDRAIDRRNTRLYEAKQAAELAEKAEKVEKAEKTENARSPEAATSAGGPATGEIPEVIRIPDFPEYDHRD